jgi:hypothetical protein
MFTSSNDETQNNVSSVQTSWLLFVIKVITLLQKPANIIEKCPDSNNAALLRCFCSGVCVDQYKLDIFTREMMLCSNNESSIRDNADDRRRKSNRTNTVNAMIQPKSSDVVVGTASSSSSSRKRAINPRPHPSHRLNKRYWDDVRAGKLHPDDDNDRKSIDKIAITTTNRSRIYPIIRQSSTITQISPPPPPMRFASSSMVFSPIVNRSIRPDVIDRVPIDISSNIHPIAWKQQQQQPSSSVDHLNNTRFIFVPIPIPIPIPIPLSERFIIEHYLFAGKKGK